MVVNYRPDEATLVSFYLLLMADMFTLISRDRDWSDVTGVYSLIGSSYFFGSYFYFIVATK